MRAFNPHIVSRNLVLLTAGLGLAQAAWAVPSVADHFATCRAEAELLYGADGEPASVRLDDVRRSGKQLRLRIVTPEGESFNAVCEVNRKTGELVSLDPRLVPGQERQVTSISR